MSPGDTETHGADAAPAAIWNTEMIKFAWRMWRSTDARLLWKILWNFCFHGMLSVEKHKRRMKKGEVFPPFIYISITNTCNLNCQGCWVDVRHPQQSIPFEDLDQLIRSAKKHGNRFFGLLGGEPFLHDKLLDLLEAHPDCYFQIFTNGHFITDEVAARMRKIGNATPLISIEGTDVVSDERRKGKNVLDKTLRGLETCVRHRLITGVVASVCQSNIDDLVNGEWVDQMIERGVHYCWFNTYRAVGPDASPELALTPDQVLRVRRFAVESRNEKPIAFVDAYWDDKGQALCPAAIGISHHISPWGDVEPCPIIQFASESIRDNDGDIFKTMTESKLLKDFRETAAKATRGCIVLERPDLLKKVVDDNGARDTTARKSAMVELEAMESKPSQHNPGNEIPEKHWVYRFAKKHWFFGFGAYT